MPALRVSSAAKVTRHREPARLPRTRHLPPVPIGPPKLAPAKPRILDYRLIVVTHGRPCLRETLEAFRARVNPQPREVYVIVDGGQSDALDAMTPWNAIPFYVERTEPRGFCCATARAWQMAAEPLGAGADGPTHVFWLEDDFVVEREIDLMPLAVVLEVEELAQMALYRDPYSDEERMVGGYLNRPDRKYWPQRTLGHDWYRHDHYWTTNPSLFRREFAARNTWPMGPECEGHFSLQLAELGLARYGVWGDGSRWVRHVASRDGGFGY